MGINKIKLQQIDADFSEIVGRHGSGYFATTGSLSSLSGFVVPYSYIETGGFLYDRGAQSVSGIKDFFSRPTLSGASLATLSEVVCLTGQQTLLGKKSFESGVSFIGGDINFLQTDVNFSGTDINFSGTNFTFDTFSRYGLADQLGSLLVHADSDQSIDGVKNFTSVPKVNGSNLLISGNPYPIYAYEAAISSRCFPIFGEGPTNGFKTPLINTSLEYNAFKEILMCKTFSGNAFSGKTLNSASGSNLGIATFARENFINFQFPLGTGSYRMGADFFAPSTSGTKDLGQANTPWANVYSSTANIMPSDRNLKTEISEIPDSWLDAWQEVDFVRYKFKKAIYEKGLSGARWHIGLISQDIHEKFKKYGLDALEIGVLCYDKWEKQEDSNGLVVQSGEVWSIRPDECQFMEMALMRRSLRRLNSGVSI